jgi:hypothetical protein
MLCISSVCCSAPLLRAVSFLDKYISSCDIHTSYHVLLRATLGSIHCKVGVTRGLVLLVLSVRGLPPDMII